MTGPNAPKVSNIPDHLDEYPDIRVGGEALRRGEDGRWYHINEDDTMGEVWVYERPAT